jgi:hypothetical protein
LGCAGAGDGLRTNIKEMPAQHHHLHHHNRLVNPCTANTCKCTMRTHPHSQPPSLLTM